jgi:hypothetical protein
MERTQTQAQTQTQTQNQNQNQITVIAQKLLSGRPLEPEEAILLTDQKVVREIYHLLWHYSAWGW